MGVNLRQVLKRTKLLLVRQVVSKIKWDHIAKVLLFV